MHDWKKLVQERIASLSLTPQAEAELVEELSQHLDDWHEELLIAGVSEADAYTRVIEELNKTYALHSGQKASTSPPPQLGDARKANLIEDFWHDLRYAIRSFRKSPVFVLTVVITLALGIGANNTVFTVINTLILNPLPVRSPNELLAVSMKQRGNALSPISYPDLKTFEQENKVFAKMAGYSTSHLATLQNGAVAKRMFVEFVTGPYFSTLGIQPANGRFFDAGEERAPVAVMNYGSWQTHFAAAPDIIGKKLLINNTQVTVVGVAPPQFLGVNAIFGPDLWMPAGVAGDLLPNEMRHATSDRTKPFLTGVGRLRAGISQTQAAANFSAIAASMAQAYPETNLGHTTAINPLREVIFGGSNGSFSQVLFGSVVLLTVVGIVLLIACSNVANLLMARSAMRQQEIAVRLALGASRRRLVRQLLTESIILGLMGGVIGLSIGYAGLHLIWSSLPTAANFIAPKFDAVVFVFTLAISLTTGILFGAIPAFRASRAGVAEALKEEARTAGRSRGKVTLANVLLVGQVSFSFLLLVIAMMFLRSIGRAYEMDPGFQSKHLALFMTSPGQAGYTKTRTQAFYKEVRERIARLPGVESISWASNLPLWARATSQLQIEGRQQRSQADKLTTIVNVVDVDYFETAGVTLDGGRTFSNVDQDGSTFVAIVNEKIANDYWPSGDAIGHRIRLVDEAQPRQIVGIAKTANYTTLGEPPQPCVYVPAEQKFSDAMTLFVRTKGDPGQILLPVQREVQAAGLNILVGGMGVRTGREIIDGGLYQARIGVILLSTFGLLALGLASVGLYGILAYSVSQRKREIGLRMALGAAQRSVLRLILTQGMSLVLTGVAIGFGSALLVARLLKRLLYGITATDPLSVFGAALALLAVAFIACYLPARWASRVDPLVALREG